MLERIAARDQLEKYLVPTNGIGIPNSYRTWN